MSGAEAALLGVGILCNAMQIITFAKDSLHVYRNIRDGPSPDPNLDLYLRNAKDAFDEMNQSATQMGPLNKTQQQIVDVGKNVHDCIDELRQTFAMLHVDDASKRGVRGRVAASKKSIATLWHGKELEDAEKNLQRHERLLHSLVLDRVCSQSQAAEITTFQSFRRLEDGFQKIISQLVDGSAKVSDLATEFSSNSDRIIKEHATTRTVIKDQVASEGSTIRLSISQSISQFREELLRREQDKALEKQREKQHEQLLSSLRFAEMNSRKNQISSNYPGTFDWVFKYHSLSHEPDQSKIGCQLPKDTTQGDSRICNYIEYVDSIDHSAFDCFPSWLESDSKLFWVSGKPASGKSSLMKFLAFNRQTANHLNNWHSNVRVLTHFFWKPGELLQRNVQGMSFSLLYQVLDGQLDLGRKLCEVQPLIRHKRHPSDWSLDEISEALVLALETSSCVFCIFLDGLDEAKDLEHLPWPDWTDSQVIHQLLEIKNLKMCVSSREEQAFCSFFEAASRMRIHQLNKYDIEHFIRGRLDICGLDCRDRDRLVHRIMSRAEGVFLWVILVVDSLNRAIRQSYTTIKMLEERLAQTPSDLTELYFDMWGRIGDDAQLPSLRAIASRYFNLVILTRKMSDYGFNDGQEDNSLGKSMSSLLVMATSTEDMSMESMLSKGRGMTVEELLARCAKVENELRLVSRGLLEVVTGPKSLAYPLGKKWSGHRRFRDSNLKKIDFIHRSAFDFIIDTEPGLQCLQACGLSESEQVSRILAGHLIRSRFLCPKYTLNYEPPKIWHTVRYRANSTNPYLRLAIIIVFDSAFVIDRSLRNGLLNIIKEWQLSGLCSGHMHGAIPKGWQHIMNPLELEFIEAGIYAAFFTTLRRNRQQYTDNAKILLDNYPTARLLHAIPFVLRALSSINSIFMGLKSPSELFKYILFRLQCTNSEEEGSLDTIRNTIRALHSWYIAYCLMRLSSLSSLPWPVTFPDMELLDQLSNTLLREDDWHHSVLFEFQASTDLHFELTQGPHNTIGDSHYALVVGNFATAYRLLDKIMFNRFSQGLKIEVPQSSTSQFEPILIADTNGHGADCYIPDMKLYQQIEYLLCATLLDKPVPTKEGLWPIILESSDSELNPMDSSNVFNYVMDEVKNRSVDFVYITGWEWLGDKHQRRRAKR